MRLIYGIIVAGEKDKLVKEGKVRADIAFPLVPPSPKWKASHLQLLKITRP